jgi:hypothetical protein
VEVFVRGMFGSRRRDVNNLFARRTAVKREAIIERIAAGRGLLFMGSDRG